jgi:Skp family chaperone for outer membrane proteins
MGTVISPLEIANLKKRESSLEGNNTIEKMLAPLLGFDRSLGLEQFQKSKDYQRILRRFSENSVLKNMPEAQTLAFLDSIFKEPDTVGQTKGATFVFGRMIADQYCNLFTAKDSLQSYCEEVTRISKGVAKPSEYYPNYSVLNHIYEGDTDKADALINMYRCEVFNVPRGKNKDRADDIIQKWREKADIRKWLESKKKQKKNLPDNGAIAKAVINARYTSVQNENYASIPIPDTRPYQTADSETTTTTNVEADEETTAESTEPISPISEEKLPDSATEMQPKAPLAENDFGQNIMPEPIEDAIAPISSVTGYRSSSSASATSNIPDGVSNVFSDSKETLAATDAETKKLAEQLAETEKKLQDLQDQAKEKEKNDLIAAVAKKEEEVRALKKEIAQARPSSDAKVAAVERRIEATAPASTSVARAAEEFSRPFQAETARTPAQVQAPTANSATPIILSLTLVELPKGMSLQDTVASHDFIMEQIVKFEGKPFRVMDPIKGEFEVIPNKGEDGKYFYVTRPIKKNDKIAEKKAPVVKPVRAPASETTERTYYYKDMNNKLIEAIKQDKN